MAEVTLPAYSVRGRGDTAVLLLHGIGGGQAIWDDDVSGTARAIAEAGFCAVAIDLPGYGASAAAAGGPDMPEFVAAVQAVIKAVAAPRTVLLGHSMGGMVAQAVAAAEAKHAPGHGPGSGVQGLILACTTAAFGRAGGDWQARFVAERLAPLDAGHGMAGMAARLVPGMVSPAAPAQAAQRAAAVMARVPEATYRAALRAIAGFDGRHVLGSIAVPTLVLAAAHDRTAPPDTMQRMAARIPGAEYVCLADAGHIANVEAPAAFNGAVVEFLLRRFGPAFRR